MRFDDAVTEHGVYERRFELDVADHVVPGLMWTPDGNAPKAIVLLGHGGGLHKRADYVLAVARRLVRHQGFAAVAIDAPGHGERTGGDPVKRLFELSVAERMQRAETAIADWQATLDATLQELGPQPVGWWGLSMGTSLGVPVVASEPRVQVAVFGLMGVGDFAGERIKTDAAKIALPILFLVQLEDELVPRETALALFDAFASTDKRMHANPGAHAAVPREEIDASEWFLAKHLAPAWEKLVS